VAFRTLGDLRGELLARLGMASAGASAGANVALLNSFLRNGQAQLYWAQDWIKLKKFYDSSLGVNQVLVNYPTTPAPGVHEERVLKIEVNIGTTATPQWRTVLPGIDAADRDVVNNTGWPCEMFADQIELSPKNDTIRTLRIWGIRKLDAFTTDGHASTLDDELVLLFALANAKAHYKQPDADSYANQVTGILSAIKGKSFTKRSFNRRDEVYAAPKPVVV
jgi:hypothetical protein